MLHEIYYGGGLTSTAIERTRDRAIRCLDNLHRVPLWSVLRHTPRDLVRVFDAPAHFQIRGTRVWAAPDLVYRTRTGTSVVVDWKTGKKAPTAEQEQVSVYGLFLQSTTPSNAPSSVEATVIHLHAGEESSYPVANDQLATAEEAILAGAQEMRQYQEIADHLGDDAVDKFPLTKRRAQCPRCNFFGLCAAELEGCPGAIAAPAMGPGEASGERESSSPTAHRNRHASLQ